MIFPFTRANGVSKGTNRLLARARTFLFLTLSLFMAPVVAYGETLTGLLSPEDARHLASRAGIGASPENVSRLVGKNRFDAVDSLIAGMRSQPAIAMPVWTRESVPAYHMKSELGDSFRVQFNNQRNRELSELRQWWVLNMLETQSPQSERLVLFWHDLFATNYYGTNQQSLAMARQNQTFREHGFGSWERLLKLMIRDTALLDFLNADSNDKRSPNENLARELLELFTLGEGEFEESTVREAARSLTGYTTNQFHNMEFQINTWKQDRDNKTLFGQEGAFDGDDLVDLILQQPAAARFLASKFWSAFVSDREPDAAWVDAQASTFRDSNYHIPTLYRNVLTSDAFWDKKHRADIIKSPVDLIVGTARTLQYPKNQWKRMPQWQSALGMSLFAPPDVAGWNEGAAFVTPGRLLDRYKLVDNMLRRANRSMQGQLTKRENSISTDMAATETSVAPVMNVGARQDIGNVHILMAAEDYKGPVNYQLRVLGEQGIIWKSSPREFTGGYPTETMGRLRNLSELGWYRVSESVPSEIVDQATLVHIAYLNDHGGPDGDRNLYIEQINWDGRIFAASDGNQQSLCPPAKSADAGNLYCAGYLEFSIPEEASQTTTETALLDLQGWHAASAYLKWARNNAEHRATTVEVLLNNVITPQQQFHTLIFTLHAKAGEPLRLQIGSYDCWPDCFTPMPDCAWEDKHFSPTSILAFPWVESGSPVGGKLRDYQCHFNSLPAHSQDLIASLWISAPRILQQLKNTNRGRRLSEELSVMLELLAARDIPLTQTPYADRAMQIEFVPSLATGLPGNSMAPDSCEMAGEMSCLRSAGAEPYIEHGSIAEFFASVDEQGLQLENLMFPDVADDDLEPLPVLKGRQYRQLVFDAVRHPLFQVK